MSAHFDSVISDLADVIVDTLGQEALAAGVILRDSSARLSFFAKDPIREDVKCLATERLYAALGVFAREDRVVVGPSDPGYSNIYSHPNIRMIRVRKTGDIQFLQVLDNQIAGMDWLISHNGELASPPRFVFASLKGGVGRSTALSVVAADQARKGRNVLVIDLDLEAPGVGSMLLDGDRLPKLGALDYLVECGLGTVAEKDLDDFVGTSQLTLGAGLVDVIPVAGRLSLDHPQHFLPKLARAMVESMAPDGEILGFHSKARSLVDRFSARRSYDLVLVDVRAGMSEITAGALLGLGAKVLLFGTAQPQTAEGYLFLFSQLKSLVRDVQGQPLGSNFQMVHAKASLSAKTHDAFKDALWALFTEYLYEELEADDLDGFNFDVNDPNAPHNPVPIPHDAGLVDWDPVGTPAAIDESIRRATFGPLIEKIEEFLSFPRN